MPWRPLSGGARKPRPRTMAAKRKTRRRSSPGNLDVNREAGTMAAVAYLRATGSRVDCPPVIGRHVGLTFALMARLGPVLTRAAADKRIARNALDLTGKGAAHG